MNLTTRAATLLIALAGLIGCGQDVSVQAANDPNAPAAPSTAGIPSDADVLAEMKQRIRDADSIALSSAGKGEVVWSRRDLTWYYQRGYIVRRAANIEGFPDAKLAVGGLSLWVFDGNGWRYQRDLVTWNTYDGIEDPDHDDLIALLQNARINYMPVGFGSKPENIRMAEKPNFEWHNGTSVSFNYVVDAAQIDWPGQKLNQATVTLRTRVYRDNVDAPWRDPITPEQVDVVVHSSEPKTPAELSEYSRQAAM